PLRGGLRRERARADGGVVGGCGRVRCARRAVGAGERRRARGRVGRGACRGRRRAGRRDARRLLGKMPPVTVAVTGGIAAGKSTALDAFRRHGAATISSDELVHLIYERDEEVRAAV